MKSFRQFVDEAGRCWPGHKPVPGKKPFSPGSCRKEDHVKELEDGLNSNAIRRAGSTFDDGLNARTTTSGLKAYSADEYMNAMLSRSASIFNPDMIAISEEFLNSQESSSQLCTEN